MKLRPLASISLLFPVTALAAAMVAGPLQYGNGLQNTRWTVSGNIFECRFAQPIEGFGEALFYQRAGESLSFQLAANRNLMDYSNARVSLLSPPWRPSEQPENLGTASINHDGPLLALDTRRSQIIMHGLMEGRRPTVTHKTGYDNNRFVQVYVSPSSFMEYYPEFLRCLGQLLTVNFDQIARTKVYFGSGDDKVDAADIKTLNRVIYYLQHDPRVKAIYLDGHNDNVGRRYDSRQISKRRVEDVENYLVSQGVDAAMITSRFHGDRYPVANNKTSAGRAENRRVTIRLEMGDDLTIPPELIFQSRFPPPMSSSPPTSSASGPGTAPAVGARWNEPDLRDAPAAGPDGDFPTDAPGIVPEIAPAVAPVLTPSDNPAKVSDDRVRDLPFDSPFDPGSPQQPSALNQPLVLRDDRWQIRWPQPP
ncbi:flagellar protein MotY [Parathalassolituus penaei]|uniref:OmpA family protein n=1 Tax=Parathalassolituus penaei TaxID=2997323 RepID=A0A9X3EEU1_9GAMM|nr:OmpA family protein [Parathalassolituus penaei]MCY0965895.1 OmpA family protein [Parathalassolituus penaei]